MAGKSCQLVWMMASPDSQGAWEETPPAWDGRDAPTSLARYAEWLNRRARLTFLQAGTHVELFFMLRPDGQAGLGAPPPGYDRDQLAAALREAIRANDIYGLVHICEAWTYLPRKPRDHTFTQLVQGEMTVSELQPEDRTEALMVRMESRDGAHRLWISPILRREGGADLGEPIDITDPPAGRFAGLFQP